MLIYFCIESFKNLVLLQAIICVQKYLLACSQTKTEVTQNASLNAFISLPTNKGGEFHFAKKMSHTQNTSRAVNVNKCTTKQC